VRPASCFSILFAATLLFWDCPGVFGQGVATIQVETHLIDTAVSVHDGDGRVVSGLRQDDFTVVEDGVPQTIRFFAHDNQLPLSIGLPGEFRQGA
jgi:Ca-activated chloride channel family protein